MKIDNNIIVGILTKLADVYPFMLETEGYRKLLTEIEESILDGHLIYLSEKGLISTTLRYLEHQREWEIHSNNTRITAHGLDYLASQPDS